MSIYDLTAYEVLQQEDLSDLKSKGTLLKHKKSGARVLLMENDDENKVFTIGFRTPPSDSTGVPHIMEHSVLCGSREFPVKDPFVELVKGSLNTFLNAMTYPDKTVYPVASCNDKDFQNLMHVYLDAVFYPNIYKREEIFRQEGWNYHLEQKEGPLKYNGVVYNEMKGAFSSPDEVLEREIMNHLFPDTTYGCESGGDPKNIPDLTYENFLNFHRTYYHPSNSYIYLYGNMDMEEKLAFLDEHYLSHFDYLDVDSVIQEQKAFGACQDVTLEYPVAENEGEEDNTYLSYNMVVGNAADSQMAMAFEVLDYALLSAPGAPLKQALLDVKAGKDVYGSYDDGILQPCFTVIAKGSNPDRKEEFVSVIRQVLGDIVKNGIDKKAVEAGINYFEFRYREADFSSYPKGLMYSLDILGDWLYEKGNPFAQVQQLTVFENLKKAVNEGYFEELIWEKLVQNTFGMIFVMKPKKGLDKENDAAEKQKLADYKASLTENELEQVVSDTKELKLYQETPSPAEDMEKVPLLSISDIRKEIHPLKNREDSIYGMPLISHDIFTNGIGYLEFIFDINDLDAEFVPYVELLTSIFKYVDTEHYTYSELSNQINFHTGGIGFSTGAMYKDGGKDHLSFFSVKTKAMYDKLGEGLKLIEEILFTSKLSDKKRLKEIISEEKAGLKTDLISSGHITSATRAMSYISDVMAFKDMTEGIGYYDFLQELDQNFEQNADAIIEKLQTTLAEILRKGAVTISYTGDNDIKEILGADIEAFARKLSTRPAFAEKRVMEKAVKNEAFKTASQVQYAALAGNYKEKGFEYTGALEVLQVIFSYGYLWENIRVKGGAYGAMCSFARSGMGYFTSYRDPNLMETYDIYKRAADYVAGFDASDRDMTKYLIGAIAKLDSPMTPSAEGAFSQTCYFAGITDEQLQKERDQVLTANVETIRSLAPVIRAITDGGVICAIGGEDKIEQNRAKFKEVKDL